MRYFLKALAVIFLLLGQVAPARSYALQFAGPNSNAQVRWPAGPINVALSASLASPPPNIKAGSDVEGAARRALAHWAAAANIQFNIFSSTALAAAADGISLITVSSVNSSLFNSAAQGRTRVVFDPSNGLISEGDVIINPNVSVQFSTDGTANTYDLESTFTHEIGHLLGLEHSGVIAATMQPRQGQNGLFGLTSQTMRTLSEDDRAGLRAIYGSRAGRGLGAINGSVNFYSAAGPAVFGAHVWAEEVSTGRVMAGNITLQSGAYRIEGLQPGEYRVVAEYLGEPVSAGETASRSGAYQGLTQAPQPVFRTVEAGRVFVAADATAALNIVVVGDSQINPTFIGTNGQLSTIPVPIAPGRTFNILVGGENLHTVSAGGVGVTSPRMTVNQQSFQQLHFGTLQVLSFEVTVEAGAPPGDYSLRLVSNTGEVTYVSGCLSIEAARALAARDPVAIPDTLIAQY